MSEHTELDNIPVNRGLTCDQVAWVLNVFDRYLPQDNKVRASRNREMMMYGMLYEVMDAAGLNFQDQSAVNNATPVMVRGDSMISGVES